MFLEFPFNKHKIPNVSSVFISSDNSLDKLVFLCSQKRNSDIDASHQVRLLLQQILDSVQITDTLQEGSYPFRLHQSLSPVCFSHSSENVCVAFGLDKNITIGVDTEQRNISMAVAQRFFHPKEIMWLQQQTSDVQKLCLSILWMCKEAFIKYSSSTLVNGIGINMFDYICTIKLLALAHRETSQTKMDERVLSVPDDVTSNAQTYGPSFVWCSQQQAVVCYTTQQNNTAVHA